MVRYRFPIVPFALSVGILGVTSLGAMAADLPVKAPPMSPPVVHNWTGFYVGGNVGYGWNDTHADLSPNALLQTITFVGEWPSSLDPSARGWVGGGQIGYNWQFNPNWLVGLEADLQAADIKGSAGAVSASGALFLTTVSTKLNYFGTVRGRLPRSSP